MGAAFKRAKDQLFHAEIQVAKAPAHWERKGSEYFSTGSISKRPEQVRVFQSLMKKLFHAGGSLFYYGDEKLRGTKKQTGRDPEAVAADALRETINRICRYADTMGDDVLLIMDAITDTTQNAIVAQMYAHIYSRSKPGMRRIIEAPLHIDSKLNAGVQLADWVCGLVGRAAHYQMVPDSEFGWVSGRLAGALGQNFTRESKLHVFGGANVHHSRLFHHRQACVSEADSIGRRIPNMHEIYLAAQRAGGPSNQNGAVEDQGQ